MKGFYICVQYGGRFPGMPVARCRFFKDVLPNGSRACWKIFRKAFVKRLLTCVQTCRGLCGMAPVFTPTIDRVWLFIPKTFPRKLGKGLKSHMHHELEKLVQQFMWRNNNNSGPVWTDDTSTVPGQSVPCLCSSLMKSLTRKRMIAVYRDEIVSWGFETQNFHVV